MSGAIQPTTSGASRLIERKLRRAWRKQRRLRHSRGLCLLAVWVVGLILLDLLVDWLFLASYRVPWYGRTALLAINAAALAVVSYHYWLRHLRRYSPVRVALQVESRHPELKSLLVSYVQMDERHRRETHASPFLVEAFKRQAIELSAGLDFREIVSFGELRKLLLFCACVLALFGAISAYKSEFFGTLLRRMLNPALAEEYPTRTVIDEGRITGDVIRPQGAKLTLTAECFGVIPDRGQLRLRAEGGPWETLPLLKQAGNVFACEFVSLQQGFDYYVRLGDDRSQTYRVQVVPPPKVIEKEITLTYPAYTGLKPRKQNSYYVEALAGTKVSWRLRTDQRLAGARIWKNQVRGPAMRISGGGFVAEGGLVAPATFEYQFNWKLADHGFFYRTPGRYVVNVIPDADPEVEITYPTRDQKATVRKVLTVGFRASDDYGLSAAYLAYKLNGGRERRVKIAPLSGRRQEKTASRKLSSLVGGLKENDLVAYYTEVVDNCAGPGGRNIGRSQARRVFLVSVPEYLRGVLEEHQRWLTEIASLRTEEIKASQEVAAMKDTGAAEPDIAGLSDRLLGEAERQHIVNQRMDLVITGLDALLRDLLSNDLAARGNGPELKRCIAALEVLSGRHVPNAARYLEEARRRRAMLQPNLAAAAGEIRIIVRRLDELLRAAGIAGTAGDVLSRLRLIIRGQEKLLARTMRWARLRIVDPRRAAFGRDELKTQQQQIAGTVRLFQGQLAEAAGAEEDVDLAKAFARGVGLMKNKRIDRMLNAAARFIGADREHSAVSRQMKALAALRELELLLDPDKLAKRIEDLKAILAALEQLLKDQQDLTGRTRRVPVEEFPRKKDGLMLRQRNLRSTAARIGATVPAPSKNIKAARGHMSAAEGDMQANRPADAVADQKLAEQAIKRAIAEVQEQYAAAMKLLLRQQMVAEWEDLLERTMLRIQALIERQGDLLRETRQADDMVPLRAPQSNLGAEASDLAEDAPAGADALKDAAGQMGQAADAMPEGDKIKVVRHQGKAIAALRRALRAVRRAMELAAEGGGAGEGEGVEEGQGEGQAEPGEGARGMVPGMGMRTDEKPAGPEVSRKDRHWDKLRPREQDALKQNFAGELPLEYRELLRDYYESLSK